MIKSKELEIFKILIQEYKNYTNKYENYYIPKSDLLKSDSFDNITSVINSYLTFIEKNTFFTKNDQIIFFDVFDFISTKLSQRGCNDFEFPENWTYEERKQLNKEVNDLNGSPEYHTEDLNNESDFTYSQDFTIMFYLRKQFLDYFFKQKIQSF